MNKPGEPFASTRENRTGTMLPAVAQSEVLQRFFSLPGLVAIGFIASTNRRSKTI
jgi:hypothetical protein